MNDLIQEYRMGPGMLRSAIAGMTPEQIDATPIPGQWSTRQVICHLADAELLYADRMKRALAEDFPTVFSVDPDAFAACLAYKQRDIEEELQLLDGVRRHMGRILQSLDPGAFQRRVNHSEAGPLTLEQLLTRVTGHIPHHARFIEAKRAAMGLS